jgi:hypothetical protein
MKSSNSDNSEICLADCLLFLAEKLPDLAAIAKAWPKLPESVRAKIVTVAEKAAEGRRNS